MVKITVPDQSPADALDIVHKMKADGWQIGVDFDFAYHQAEYNNDGYEAVNPRRTDFMFHRHELATLFSLKWL
jgi:hypothetical protein